jgi:uracil-DNA glycosylase
MSQTNYSSKAEALTNLKEGVAKNNNLPLLESNLVFGEGSPEAEILFIGEAPGFHENAQGRPFVGQAGKLLDAMITELGWRREDVYITNIVKRRPPENRDPLPEEIEAYAPYLMKQVEIINPKIIATLGRFSMNFFLPETKISRDQGKVFWWKDRLVVPLYHPAAALRATAIKEELKKSFAKLPIIKAKYEEFKKDRELKMTEQKPQKTPDPKKETKKQMGLF